MTDGKARTIQVPLRFLGSGTFRADSWLDDESAKHGLKRQESRVANTEELVLPLQPAGGAYARLVPTP
jgi:hypothetical protein